MLSLRKQKQEASLRRRQDTKKSLGQAPLKVSDYLAAERIFVFPGEADVLRIFSGLVGAFSIPNPESALEAILRREQVGGTIIAPGIALPHARIDGTDKLHAALALCPDGIKLRDDQPLIRLFLVFVSPFAAFRNHLRFLAASAALFQNKTLLEKLLPLNSGEGVLQKIKEEEAKTQAGLAA